MVTLYPFPEVNRAKNVLALTKTWKNEKEHKKQAGESHRWLLHRFSGCEGQMPLPLGVTIQWCHTTDVHFPSEKCMQMSQMPDSRALEYS